MVIGVQPLVLVSHHLFLEWPKGTSPVQVGLNITITVGAGGGVQGGVHIFGKQGFLKGLYYETGAMSPQANLNLIWISEKE